MYFATRYLVGGRSSLGLLHHKNVTYSKYYHLPGTVERVVKAVVKVYVYTQNTLQLLVELVCCASIRVAAPSSTNGGESDLALCLGLDRRAQTIPTSSLFLSHLPALDHLLDAIDSVGWLHAQGDGRASLHEDLYPK